MLQSGTNHYEPTHAMVVPLPLLPSGRSISCPTSLAWLAWHYINQLNTMRLQ